MIKRIGGVSKPKTSHKGGVKATLLSSTNSMPNIFAQTARSEMRSSTNTLASLKHGA